eukprot:9214632-Pyramimonas_sp.AAC.1
MKVALSLRSHMCFAAAIPRPAFADVVLSPTVFIDVGLYDCMQAFIGQCTETGEADRSSRKAPTDPDNNTIVEYCLVSGGLTLTLSADSKLAQVDRKKYRAVQADIAMACVLFERLQAVKISQE